MKKYIKCVGRVENGKIKMKKKCPVPNCKNTIWEEEKCCWECILDSKSGAKGLD